MIRLQRVGRKHEPTFRVVLTDSKNSTKSGKFLEILGSYDARKNVDVLHSDRIKEWMEKGAQVSDTMHNLLIKHKVIEAKKKNVLPRKSPYKTETKLAEEKAREEAAEAKAKADRAEAEARAAEAEKEKATEETQNNEEAVSEESVETVTSEELPTETDAPETSSEEKA